MSAPRTLLASLLIGAAGVATLAAASDGFRAFSSQAALRLERHGVPGLAQCLFRAKL